MFDCHMHTNFSTDSKMRIEEVIKASKELDIGCIITEHLDFKFPKPGAFVFDIDEYFKTYSNYRSEKLLLGIELGMKDDCISENKDVASKYPFDYIIGSTHMVNNKDLYFEEIYLGRSKKEVYTEYLENILQNVKSHIFVDSLGHIDYIARYARYDDREIYYDDYTNLFDEILKAVIDRGLVLELNTRRLNDNFAVNNLINIYKRYKELGGANITIGSDAHNMLDIGNNYKIAMQIAEITCLEPIYFKNRRPEYI